MSLYTTVREFNAKYDYPCEIVLGNHELSDVYLDDVMTDLYELNEVYAQDAIRLHYEEADPRLYRALLMVEELAEVVEALLKRDVVKLADGLGDLLYVVVGTAVTYGIPIDPIFEEIHRSNMTKEKTDPRMRNKGPLYTPPRVDIILRRHGHDLG